MKGRDAITGFEGIVVGVCRYLTGCDTVLLVPTVDGSVKGGEDGGRWFDVDRVEVHAQAEAGGPAGHDSRYGSAWRRAYASAGAYAGYARAPDRRGRHAAAVLVARPPSLESWRRDVGAQAAGATVQPIRDLQDGDDRIPADGWAGCLSS